MSADLLNAQGIDIPVELRPTIGTAYGLLQSLAAYRDAPGVPTARALADAWDGYRKVFACSGLADDAWQRYRDRCGLWTQSYADTELQRALCDNAALEFAELLLGDLRLAEKQ